MHSRFLSVATWATLGALLLVSATADELPKVKTQGVFPSPPGFHVAGPPLPKLHEPPFAPRWPPITPQPFPPPKQRILPPMGDIPNTPVAGNADPKQIPQDQMGGLDGTMPMQEPDGVDALPAGNASPEGVPQNDMPNPYDISSVADQETFSEDLVMTTIICGLAVAAAAMVFVGGKMARKTRLQGASRDETVPLVCDEEVALAPTYGSSADTTNL